MIIRCRLAFVLPTKLVSAWSATLIRQMVDESVLGELYWRCVSEPRADANEGALWQQYLRSTTILQS